MKTPNSNTATNVLPGSQPQIIRNNINSLPELKVRIATTANGAKSNLLIFAGPVPTFASSRLTLTVPEQTECVLSSTISAGNAGGYVEFKQYLAQVGMLITYIRMITATTAIYDGSLYICEMPPNGIPNPEEIPLSPYAQTLGGGGYDKTLLINDRTFATTGNFFMYLSSMPASATLDIAFGIGSIGDSITA